ncbi:MAG: S8 family serine peptidase [Candidatus Fermentibacteraceae bacterium]|nr:S8 family serine peptidase [Candidatus Fermentibacteraceae bacterium]
MAVFSVLLLAFFSAVDYPVLELPDQVSMQELALMNFSGRQTALAELNTHYTQLEFGSGPLLTGSFSVTEGSLVLINVYRSLTPGDLAILDRAGFWPSGFAPSSSAFVAVAGEKTDLNILRGHGFVRSVSVWSWNDAVAPGDRGWTGGWLVSMAPGFVPAEGTAISDEWWLVSDPVAEGVVAAIPNTAETAVNHAVNVQADDSRDVTGLPNLWNYYTGLGVRIGVLDTGVWSEHPDLAGSVVAGPADPSGHGTAVCGVIASRGEVDLGCEYNGSGGAPDVQLYVIRRPESMTPAEFAAFYTEFHSNDCRTVNNSWGFDGSTSYDGFCQVVDTYGRNGGMAVFSSGNNPSPGAIPSPAISRNAVTTGAVTFLPDSSGNVVVAPYSGRGPTSDGRLKPEILAPGGAFLGATMQNGVATTNAFYGGQWLDDPENRWPGEPSYTRYTGTSMAAAFVSSALAICEEKYGDLFNPEDAMALMAACAIPLKSNTGSSLSGYATVSSGYGLLDGYHLPGTYFSEEVDRLMWINSSITEGIGYKQWTMYVPAYTSWISLGLGYSDVPSASPDLQVDLDVTLVSPSNVEYNYQLPSGVTSPSPVERIVVENPEPGAWNVRVEGVSWADPGNPSEQQQFAVAAYRFARDPELSVSFPVDTTIYAPPGGELIVPVTIANTGGYVAVGAWASLHPPSAFSGDVDVPAFMGNLLYKNSTASAEFTIQCPNQPGTHTVDVIAGAGNRGLDNTASQFTIVLAYPDLTVSIASPDVQPPFGAGQTVGFSVVVSNDGDGPSPASQLAYYITDRPDSLSQQILMFEVPPLESGETASFKGSYTFTYFDIGSRYLVSVVDPNSVVTENDETNNTSVYGPFTVAGEFAPPVDLVAVSGNNGFIPLTWEPPQAVDNRGLTSYRLYRSVSPVAPEPDPVAELGSSTLFWTDSLVVNGIGYYYWATCVYSAPDGESPLSNMASATAQGPSGSLGGTVTDVYTGHNLEDIIVSILGLGVTAETDNNGYYYFGDVPVGAVPINVDQESYVLFLDTAAVEENQHTEFDVGLIRKFPPGLTVIPTPFTPNGDGVNDTASFVWPAAQGAVIRLILMNIEGVPVKEITNTEPVWNGNDNTGHPVPSGVYIFHASAPVGEVTGTVCIAR